VNVGGAVIASAPEPGAPSRGPYRDVVLLALGWAVAQTVNVLLITAASVLGRELAADASNATLPVAVQHLATTVATVPASLLMQRIGRRGGFVVGTLIGLCGAALGLGAVWARSFALLCLGSALIGLYLGSALFYRFAAADAASESFRAKAISLVMAGGVTAGLSGPSLAVLSRDSIPDLPFAGCYAAVGLLLLVALGGLAVLRVPPPPRLEAPARPLREIARQADFKVAVIGGMVAYGSMAFVMTATPLAMMGCAHSFAQAAHVVRWHTVAMFAPSFFTGDLIGRFGVLGVMLAGVLLLLACVGVSGVGTSIPVFFVALVLLGVGWNFLFVGSTTLLTRTYRPWERAKVQAVNDFLVLGSVAVAAFLSGGTLHHFGWSAVNDALVPFGVICVAAIVWLALRRRRDAALR
jgi:MFS family permease